VFRFFAFAGFIQLHQRRQEPGQRLAASGRRDQQHRAVLPRLLEQFELVRARLPAAAGEPAEERLRQQIGCGGLKRRQ